MKKKIQKISIEILMRIFFNNLYFLEQMTPSDDSQRSEDQNPDQDQTWEDMLELEDEKEDWYWVSFYYLYK